MKVVLTLLMLFVASAAQAELPKLNAAIGGHGIWFNEDVKPSDLELGGSVAASLSSHISAVGSGWFGTDKSYLRGTAGVRVTATDIQRTDFSVGVGISRWMCSEPLIREEEWVADVSVGWKPWPAEQPRLIIALQGGYGLDSSAGHALAGIRYAMSGGE